MVSTQVRRLGTKGQRLDILGNTRLESRIRVICTGIKIIVPFELSNVLFILLAWGAIKHS